MMMRHQDIAAFDSRDERRLDNLVDGLPLFGRVQFTVDTTLVSPLHSDWTPTRGAVGWCSFGPLTRKEPVRNPGVGLVVLAGAVAGPWSEETLHFIGLLARAWVRNDTEQARRLRWWTFSLAAVDLRHHQQGAAQVTPSHKCLQGRALGASWLGMRSCCLCSDGVFPLADNRQAGLG